MHDELSIKLRKSTLVNSKGQTYTAFRKTMTPKYRVVWSHIGLGWLTLFLLSTGIIAFAGLHIVLDLLLISLGAMSLGFVIAYLQLFFHEAAHYNLHADRQVNDVLCNLFVSGIVGQDIKKYRPIHWDHHRHIGSPEDTEISYFDPLNIKLLVTSLLGIRAIKVVAHRKKIAHENPKAKSTTSPNAVPFTLLGGLLFNGLLLAMSLYFEQWVMIIAWIVGVMAWFPFFGVLRQIIEHRDEYADPASDYTQVAHGAIHRLFGDSLLAATLGGAGFNRHLLHHWDPQISYTRLREIEHFLMDTAGAAYLQDQTTTYTKTFRRLFNPVWR